MPSLFFKWTLASLVHLLQLRVVAPPMVVSSNERACPIARRPRSGAAQLVSRLGAADRRDRGRRAQMSALDWLRLLDEPAMTARWHGHGQAR